MTFLMNYEISYDDVVICRGCASKDHTFSNLFLFSSHNFAMALTSTNKLSFAMAMRKHPVPLPQQNCIKYLERCTLGP